MSLINHHYLISLRILKTDFLVFTMYNFIFTPFTLYSREDFCSWSPLTFSMKQPTFSGWSWRQYFPVCRSWKSFSIFLCLCTLELSYCKQHFPLNKFTHHSVLNIKNKLFKHFFNLFKDRLSPICPFGVPIILFTPSLWQIYIKNR